MNKSEKIIAALIVLFFVILATGTVIAILVQKSESELTNRPELSEHVEVVGKRIKEYENDNRSREYYDIFIVAFKFPDGSVKEFQVDRVDIDKPGTEGYSDIYESLQEGDTGILTYKEAENLEQGNIRESIRYDYRKFISFKVTFGPQIFSSSISTTTFPVVVFVLGFSHHDCRFLSPFVLPFRQKFGIL